jgi:hypothetical protein
MKSDRMFASFWELVGSSRMGRDDDVDFTVIVIFANLLWPPRLVESLSVDLISDSSPTGLVSN